MEDDMRKVLKTTFQLSALAIMLAGLTMSGASWAEGDATKGAKAFNKCVACHSAKDATNKTGPHLLGIVGRAVASVPAYKYSPAMVEFAKTTLTWDEATLDTYLADPRKTIPGTKMALAPLKKPEERADLIAYLKTLAAP
jgi:cytochrome c